MKSIMKVMVRSTFLVIGMAMAIFCITSMVFDIKNGGNFHMENYQFTKMVLGCVFIGLGFGLPSAIYCKENLPMPVKVIIHMGTGCIVYTIVAYAVGWIDSSASVIQGIISIAVQLAVSFSIWFLFMRYYHKEAKMLNDRIQNLKK